MITRIYLISIAILISCFYVGEGFASVSYIPAPQISLTGATTDIRFDVAEPLFGSDFSGAYLDTSTENMSGAFYIRDIGWALMSSGAYQVKIQCSQVLESLTSDCEFTGSGWAENIGELSFANVRYNPSSGKLSGSIGSFAGDFSVDGVSLPLRPVDLVESLTGLTAHHATTLTVQSGSEYGDGTWDFKIIPMNSARTKLFTGSSVGHFTVDLSFADEYTWEVTDPQGSKTLFYSVEVKPNLLAKDLDSAVGTFIEDICTFDSSACPDTPRSATKLEKTGSDKVADGASYYDFTLKPRDKYGNRVDTGSVEISYTGTVSAVQMPTNIISLSYLLPNSHDALVFSGELFITTYDGHWENMMPIPLSGQDIRYKIASIAPTNTTDNIAVLNRILYTAVNGLTTTITDPTATHIEFLPAYTATIEPPTSILVGSENRFEGTFDSFVSGPSLNPELITLLLIGDGLFADFKDLASDLVSTEASPDNSWFINSGTPSRITIPSPSSLFGFTGTYAPRTAFPVLENVTLQSFVHYNISGNMEMPLEVVYPQVVNMKKSEYKVSRIKILGQNNARAEYGTISTTKKSRADVFNQIRKSVALMTRNRTSNDPNAPYAVYTTNTDIGDSSFDTKQTMVMIGADITITGDIERDSEHPLAIIALAKDGVGGNIIIEDDVTDIHASLFAEHAVLSFGDRQLYIGGSLVSGNTLGETAAGICPYYVTGLCDAKKYDLEELRTYDGTPGKEAKSSTAGQYPGTSLIIEYDMRLQTDPPPGLSQ